MKGLLVKNKEVEIVDISISHGNYVCNGVQYEKVKLDENGLFARTMDNNKYPVYSLKGKFVESSYPDFFVVDNSYTEIIDWEEVIDDVLLFQKINQAELSRKTGVSTPHICALKKGTRKMPSFDIGLAIIKLHPNAKKLLGI